MSEPTPGIGSERSIRVHLDAIRHNIAEFRKWVSPSAVMAVVKGDAYGHGAVPVARAAIEGGATWLGVAHVSEALALRSAAIHAPTLAWLHTPLTDFKSAIEGDVTLGVSSVDELHRVARAADATGTRATVHLKIDTGLGRNGATPDSWGGLVAYSLELEETGAVMVEGVFSHLSVAENATRDAETNRQNRLFTAAVNAAKRHGLEPRRVHLANTAAALRLPDTHYDMVRIGLGTYGLSPLRHSEHVPLELRPALSMHSVLSAVKILPADHGVSYGAQHITSHPTVVGLVPMGYGDGIPREARGMTVTIKGVSYPILGIIAMDQMVVDLGSIETSGEVAKPGDEVTVMTLHGRNAVDRWAIASGSTNYELITKLTRRPTRIYLGTRHRS